MKKIILTIAVLAFSATAFAQDFDFEELDHFNKIELSKSGAHVETDLSFAFPMHFGWTTLTNINYKGAWATGEQSNFLVFNTGKNFVYGLQLVGMDIRYGALSVKETFGGKRGPVTAELAFDGTTFWMAELIAKGLGFSIIFR